MIGKMKERDCRTTWQVADLTRRLAAQPVASTTDQFEAVFDVVERWWRTTIKVRGDHDVRQAATIGPFEAIQNN
jgi:predicted SpoU family rRNA methylase